ncbi:MAG: hypothetical protein JXB17_07755, partial [Bacteroidales bacterium]|nr:hypothetical protein [Bacteroidales bacterium]
PGIFTIISHLENNLGAYIVEGGMYNLAKALYKLAVEIGVNFYFNTTVSEIIIENHKAIGIKVSSKKYISDITISNADVNTTYNELLPDIKSPNIFLNQPRSSSSLIFYWAVNKKFPELDLHNILFSNDYKTEFAYIFDKKEVYHDPTIYIYITSKLFLQDAPENCENWFVSINVPCNEGQDWDRIINQSKVNIKNKINRLLNVNIDSHIEFEKIDDPRSIEHFTSSYKGALYGANSNNPFSAFLRHPNFSRKIKNLYFCGGTVHPGGGIPLCLLSGKITAELIEND